MGWTSNTDDDNSSKSDSASDGDYSESDAESETNNDNGTTTAMIFNDKKPTATVATLVPSAPVTLKANHQPTTVTTATTRTTGTTGTTATTGVTGTTGTSAKTPTTGTTAKKGVTGTTGTTGITGTTATTGKTPTTATTGTTSTTGASTGTTEAVDPELAALLEELQLTSLAPVFVNEMIDYKVFLSLKEDQLKELKIPMGARIKILQKLSEVTSADNKNMGSASQIAPQGPNIYIKNVKVEKKVGEGNFGVVYKGVWQGRNHVALKALKDSSLMEEFKKELDNLMGLRSPQIVMCYGVFIDNISQKQYIVTEWCDQGDLKNFLRDNEKTLSTQDIVHLAIDVAVGMIELGRNGIVHRDLAARNILVVKDNNMFRAKVNDLGLARRVSAGSAYYRPSSKSGGSVPLPIKWTAPV